MRGFGSAKIWSHLAVTSGDLVTNKEIRHSEPFKVGDFKELVKVVARISNHNPDHSLYFRGQDKDYQLSSGASSFYPTILRSPGRSLAANELKKRYALLDECSSELLKQLGMRDVDNLNKLKKFPELLWSILQHYEVCGTPLMDFTHSLRVAASFALANAKAKGYVFVFAFPYPNGTISYSTEDELLNVRLLSACPSEALRPHFQEGYLLGSFPSREERKQPYLDFGRRLIAKIEIPASSFWDSEFHEIPLSALYPEDDEIKVICARIKKTKT